MPFEKICAYAPCSQPFVTVSSKSRYHSISCAAKDRTVESPEEVKAYLQANIEMPESPEGCWIWKGATTDSGYGLACVRNTRIRAHRMVYETVIGPIPPYMALLHGSTCHTRRCVNPAHVRIGTNLDNVRDRQAWGNEQRGSVHYATDLTETEVLHILQEFHDKGLTIGAIVKKRQANFVTIHDIIHRNTWTHVAPGLYPAPGDQRAIINKTMVREIRRLHEQEGWEPKAIVKKMVADYPGLDLTYEIIVDVCTYRTWKNLPTTPEEPLPQEPLTEASVRLMLGKYAAACAEAKFQGRKIKITQFAERYAHKFGTTNMNIRMILKRQTWKSISWDCLNIGPFCNCCGDCLVCHGEQPCYASEDHQHSLYVPTPED